MSELPDAGRWRSLEPLLDRLFEAADEERPALAAALGAEHPEHSAELLALAAAGSGAGILDVPVGAFIEHLQQDEDAGLLGTLVGAWRLVSVLGRGGMGIVYLAERAGGDFQQQGALKLLRRGVDTDEVLVRFRRERRILSRLEHRHIARLLDGGATADGRPYLVMEHVPGVPIVAWCDARSASLEERLRLFIDVCGAVAHAHRALVVHRDLKPSNILVTAGGEVKLLDFGIAKLLGAEEDEGPVTHVGGRPMTPRYAAPEQVAGEPITTATDTYALGLILYELLVSASPYRLRGTTDAELERAIVTGEVEPPSARVDDAAAARLAISRQRLRRALRGDLDSIVLKALRREPERRYPSTESLSRDIERYLEGLPVAARPDALAYRARKFVRRHALGTAMAALLLASLLAGLGAVSWQGRQARRERDRAERVSRFLVELFNAPHPLSTGGRDVSAREIVDRGAERIEKELGAEPALQGELAATMALVYLSLGLHERAAHLYERSSAHWERAEGFPGSATLAARVGLANTLVRAGQFERGLALFEETLGAQRRLLGPRHEDTLRTMNDLAFWYGETGRHGDAVPLVREVLRHRQATLGADHYDTLWSANDLAVAYIRVGRGQDAAALLEPAIATWRRTQRRTPDTFLDNLADAYRGLGRVADAHRVMDEVVTHRLQVFGAEHPQTLVAQRNLSLLLTTEGRIGESEALVGRALAGLVKVLRRGSLRDACGAARRGQRALAAGTLRRRRTRARGAARRHGSRPARPPSAHRQQSRRARHLASDAR